MIDLLYENSKLPFKILCTWQVFDDINMEKFGKLLKIIPKTNQISKSVGKKLKSFAEN